MHEEQVLTIRFRNLLFENLFKKHFCLFLLSCKMQNLLKLLFGGVLELLSFTGTDHYNKHLHDLVLICNLQAWECFT